MTPRFSNILPSLVVLAFECGNNGRAIERLFELVDGALASEDPVLVWDIRGAVEALCGWLADSGVDYSEADEEALLGFRDALAERELELKFARSCDCGG